MSKTDNITNGLKKRFYVIQFLHLPHPHFKKLVCVPYSWILIRQEHSSLVKVAYPTEDQSITQKRCQKRERFGEKWPSYSATIKHGSDNYHDALKWIMMKEAARNSIIKDNGTEPKLNGQIESAHNNVPSTSKIDKPHSKATDVNPWNPKVKTSSKLSLQEAIVKKQTQSNEFTQYSDAVPPHSSTGPTVPHTNKVHSMSGTLNSKVYSAASTSRWHESPITPTDAHKQDPSKEGGLSETTRKQDKQLPTVPETNKVHSTSGTLNSQAYSAASTSRCHKSPVTPTHSNCQDSHLQKTELDHPFIRTNSDEQYDFQTTFNQMSVLMSHASDLWNNLNNSIVGSVEICEKLLEAVNKSNVLTTNMNTACTSTDGTQATPLIIGNSQHAKDNDISVNNEARALVLPSGYDGNNPRWTLLHQHGTDDLVELLPPSQVYVNSQNFYHCLQISKDCETLGSLLQQLIFSPSALNPMKITGGKVTAFSNIGQVKFSLNEHASKILRAFVQLYGLDRGWTPLRHLPPY